MSCNNPNYVIHKLDPDTGQIVSHFAGPAKYLDPLDFGSPESLSGRGWYITPVPCGKCQGCRADRSREWSVRMLLELEDMKDAIFVTLTYNDAHLPRNSYGTPTLDKRDYQLYLKRLRKHFPGKKIRYVLSGEYGSRTYRPHYHAIIFGLSLRDFPDIRQQSINELGHPFFTSPTMERIWSNGYILMSGVTFHTCNYVARYTLKKQFGRKDEYEDGRKPEFMVTSRRPGIVNEQDVATALESKNFYFGTDVLQSEPMAKDHPLLNPTIAHKLIITPHYAWAYDKARARLIDGVRKNIQEFVKNKV